VRLVTHRDRYELGGLSRRYPVEPLFVGDGMVRDWGRLWRSLGRHEDEIVHFQSLIAPRRDWMAILGMRRLSPRRRFVLTAHNILPHEIRRGERWAYRRLYGAVDGIITRDDALNGARSCAEKRVRFIPFMYVVSQMVPKPSKVR